MKYLPKTNNPLVLRTDFSSPSAWARICEEIQEPVDGFLAYVEFVDDKAYQEIGKEELLQFVPKNYEHSIIIVVDHNTVSQPGFPLQVIDLYDEPGREFRTIPSQVQAIENNLSIANMDFEEFAEAVDDDDGVFRGFSYS